MNLSSLKLKDLLSMYNNTYTDLKKEALKESNMNQVKACEIVLSVLADIINCCEKRNRY